MAHADMPRSHVTPIPWPNAAELERARDARLRADYAADVRAKATAHERLKTTIDAAQRAGHEQGHRQGWHGGVQWGLLCGGVAGMLATAALIIGALRLGMLTA